MQAANSGDPNEKLTAGVTNPNDPAGVGYVRPGETLSYTVRFENVPTATAPAPEVFVTDRLPAEVDPTTVEFLSFGFGSTAVQLAAGTRSVRTRVDLTPAAAAAGEAACECGTVETQAVPAAAAGLVVDVEARIDPATGDRPADALAGFLPPNDATGRGQGYVTFTARPRAGVGPGAAIRNGARIVFDTNAPIDTNVIENRIDAAAPVARVDGMPVVVTDPAVPVSSASTWPPGT